MKTEFSEIIFTFSTMNLDLRTVMDFSKINLTIVIEQIITQVSLKWSFVPHINERAILLLYM